MEKICLVIHSLGRGGMERVMSLLAENFSLKKGLQVELILIGMNRSVDYDIPRAVNIHRPTFEFNNSRRWIDTVRTMAFLRKKIKEIGPDRVLSFGEYWNSLVLLSTYGTGYPVYVSDRCKPDKSLGRVHNRLRKLLYPGAAGIIAQTDYAKDFYQREIDHKNIQVIGNPIREIKEPEKGTEKENVILTVGRLIQTKHHDRLIRIFKKMGLNDWKLVIVGGNAIKQDGMSRLKELVHELDMDEKVVLTGEVEDVDQYYRKSKLFAFTSSSEGFPNVIGEAMSAGLPVVAYDCIAGPSDLIEDGMNGFLIPLFDDEQYKEKLMMLVENEDLRKRMGEQSAKLVKKYSSDFICDVFYSFIND
ncbi:glycosyltransferase [Rhodohalobacter mucosus]|uniref:Galactosyltransferase n=1 Tax=Rhodohalobacter mucosus TaxID=2079485 RepID=A0A316TT81_9BACT|nr:glycosyltransferase [Rhodohalobacter mucosus]PWN07803.1 galactosyltransferase [Rhodohalobacter mucosus]